MSNILSLCLALFLLACAGEKAQPKVDLSVSVDEMAKAISQFRESDGDLLFLLTVDRQGTVIRADFIEGRVKHLDKQRLKSMGYQLRQVLTYPPASATEPEYRQTFFVTKYSSKVEVN